MKLTPSEASLVVRSLRWINDNCYGDPVHDKLDGERHALIAKLEPLARRADLSNPNTKDNHADR